MLKQLLLVLFLLSILSGCTSNTLLNTQTSPIATTTQERHQQLLQLHSWSVKGKIAFIEQKKRQSANLYWLFEQKKQTVKQQIDLTTFLGINILHVESFNNRHTIEVDGENYQGTDLTKLIYDLTGMLLPTEALTYWLKGIVYSENDHIIYQKNSPLPKTLLSDYYQKHWQISYQHFQIFQGYQLPTKLEIKQGNLIIKIRLNHWSIK